MTVGELQNALKKAVDINVHNSDMEVVFVDELGERKKIACAEYRIILEALNGEVCLIEPSTSYK